jgi:RimJ/RimL family protein N-acetyltransferase
MFSFERLTLGDLPFLIEVRNECRDQLHDNRVFTVEECEQWFRETNPDFRVIRYNGERIGYFRISHYDPSERSVYIGADLHKSFRGKHLAKRAYKEFLPRLNELLPISVVRLEVLSHNRIARALYEKLGFVETGRKKDYTKRNGACVDSILMQMAMPKAPNSTAEL